MPYGDAVSSPLYSLLFRRVLVHLDPETAHHLTVCALAAAQAVPGGTAVLGAVFGRGARARAVRGDEGPWNALGMEHPSPFGLAAGFDKDARVIPGLLALGFGHIEVGTITPRPQGGNPRPRSFRLLADRALINRMGFNNAGAPAARRRLARARRTPLGRSAVIGVNIGKNKTTPPELAAEDYRVSARILAPLASYLAINVSSPNTPGLRDLQSVSALEPILVAVLEEARASHARTGRPVPVLVKIAPDLHDEDVRELARLARRIGLAGIIAANTTIARPASLAAPREQIEQIGAGGLSGPVLADRAIEILALLREENARADHGAPALTLISCGGIVTAQDVAARLAAGADLVQGYTSLIYEGPGWPGRIARALRRSPR